MSARPPGSRRRIWWVVLSLLVLVVVGAVATRWWFRRSKAALRGPIVAWVAVDDNGVAVVHRERGRGAQVGLYRRGNANGWWHWGEVPPPSGGQESLRVTNGIVTLRTEREGADLRVWAWALSDGDSAWSTESVALPGTTLAEAPSRLDDGKLLFEIVNDGGPALVVLDPTTGAVKWRSALPPVRHAFAWAGRLIVQDVERHAWHVVDGSGVKPALNPTIVSPCRLGDRFVATYEGALISAALDGQDRRELVATLNDLFGEKPADSAFLEGCLGHGRLLVLALKWSRKFELLALDRQSHSLVWRTRLAPEKGWGQLPRGEVGRYALIPLTDLRGGGMSLPGRRQLASVDLKQGAVKWRRASTNRSIPSRIDPGRFTYLRWKDHALMGFDTETGEIISAVRAPRFQEGTMGDPPSKAGWSRFQPPKEERLWREHESAGHLWIATESDLIGLDGRNLQPLSGEPSQPLDDLMPRLDELLPLEAEAIP